MKTVVVIVICCLCAALCTAASAQNLLTNPGFENGYTGWAKGAQSGGAVWHSTQIGHVSDPHSGSYYGLGVNLSSTNPYLWTGQTVSGIVAGKRYRGSAYVKTQGAQWAAGNPSGWVRVTVNTYNQSGGLISTIIGQSYNKQTDWRQLEISFVAPSGCTSVQFVVEARVVDLWQVGSDYQFVAWDDACLGLDSNCLYDASFETARKDSWGSWASQGVQSAGLWTTALDLGQAGARTGSNYLAAEKLKGVAPDDTTTGVYGWIKQTVASLPVGDYEASIWVKRAGTGGANWGGPNQWVRLSTALNNASGVTLAAPSVQLALTSREWTQLIVPFSITSDIATTAFTIEFKTVDQSDTSWFCFDDASIHLVEYVDYSQMSQLRNLPDGTAVKMLGKTVSRAWPYPSSRFYVEETDRTCGIGVVGGDGPGAMTNDIVDVYGKTATLNNERVVQCKYYEITGTATEPIKSLGLNGKSVSSGDYGALSLLANYDFESGITPWLKGTTGSCVIKHSAEVSGTLPSAHTGSGFVVQYNSDVLPPGARVYGRTYQRVLNPAPGSYVAEAWVYTGGGGSSWAGGNQYAQIAVVTTSGGSPTETDSSRITSPTNAWTLVSVPFTVPQGCDSMEMNLHGYLSDQYPGAYLCFDGAKLVPAGLPSGLSPQGLLVTVWGTVSDCHDPADPTPGWLLMDDGSGVSVKVDLVDPYIWPANSGVSNGSVVAVIGVCAGVGPDGSLIVRLGLEAELQKVH